jgi:glycosyltransferase involved in cell wall biosynthesis
MTTIPEAKLKVDNGRTILDVNYIPENELPFVSIVTVTKDRKHLFDIPIHNWTHFQYPKNKLEWIIVDDSKDDSLQNILPYGSNIKYFHIKSHMPIADKRNFAVKKCSFDLIMNMDDDDYYFPDSIAAKVRVLKHFDKDVVFSYPIGVYDKISYNSALLDTQLQGNNVSENTMMFKKSFWKKYKFGCEDGKALGESYNMFIKNNNDDKTVKIPFIFNMIAITHKNNVTGNTRRIKTNRQGNTSHYKSFDRDFKKLLEKL